MDWTLIAVVVSFAAFLVAVVLFDKYVLSPRVDKIFSYDDTPIKVDSSRKG